MSTLSAQLTVEKVAIKYGLLTFLGLTVYFLIMKFAGLFQIIELRYLNGLFMVFAIWKALNYYKKNSNTELTYFEGLGLGTMTAVVAAVPFGLFILLYLIVDTNFMVVLQTSEMFGQYLNPVAVGFLIAFEGLVSGVMISFVLMQYLKGDQRE